MHTTLHTSLLGEEFKRVLRDAVDQDAREREDIVRWLLGRWVSGLEPAVAVDSRSGQIIGLCDADAVPGSSPYILRI